jgi:hypothetical protein
MRLEFHKRSEMKFAGRIIPEAKRDHGLEFQKRSELKFASRIIPPQAEVMSLLMRLDCCKLQAKQES